jgi:hypothetical protein
MNDHFFFFLFLFLLVTLAVDRQSSSTSASLEYLNWSQQPASFFFLEKKEEKDQK